MKYLLLNQNQVIIDIVEELKPVMRNRNGITVFCKMGEEQGYIGSDNNIIYPKIGSQFIASFYDIASVHPVDKVPDGVCSMKWKYGLQEMNSVEFTFFENSSPYPESNVNLNVRATDLEEIVLDMSAIIYA